MSDSQAMRIAKTLTNMNEKMSKLVHKLADHPNGKRMIEALRGNMYDNPAHADDVVVHSLSSRLNWGKDKGEWVYLPSLGFEKKKKIDAA